ncbi:MAG: family 16 glycoside hydrolase [Roseibacillus sp.]
MKNILTLLSFASFSFLADAAKHPAFDVESIALEVGKDPQVGGLDILADGKIAAVFHDGELRLYDAATKTWSVFASGLHEPLGLVAENESTFVVMQRPELTRISDSDGDGVADLYETICDDFGMSGNYHEFAFGPVRDANGDYFVSLNVASNGASIREEIRGEWLDLGLSREGFYVSGEEWKEGVKKQAGRMYSRVPYRGWVIKVDGETGEMTPWASGVRSPNGLGFDAEGKLFVSDNQGDWLGTSKLHHIEKGKFYGHPASLPWTEGYDGPASVDLETAELEKLRTPAAVWFTQSTMANSPTQPILIPEGFGPFGGQMLIGEMNKPRVIRLMLEEVNGVTQGACAPFIDNNGLDMGVNRLAFASDGSLVLGHSHLSWPGGEGMSRITFHGKESFQEVKDIKITPDGFLVEFLEKIPDPAALAEVTLDRYTFDYHVSYGSKQIDKEAVALEWSARGDAGTTFEVTLEKPHRKDFCYEFQFPMSLNPLLCYTVREIPNKGNKASKETVGESYQWVDLLAGDSLELWRNGSKHNYHKVTEVGEQWSLKDGVLSLDKSKEGRGGHLITKDDSYFDFEFKFEFMISEEGNSGVKYRVNKETVGLEYQVYDDAISKVTKNSLASLYNLKAASAKKQAKTPGKEWNTGRIVAVGNSLQHWLNGDLVLEIEFDSEEWKEAFAKSKYKEDPTFARSPGPIHLQDHGSDVQFRNLRIRKLMDTE